MTVLSEVPLGPYVHVYVLIIVRTRVHTRVPWYVHVYVQHYLKNDLKYKHSGATGKLVGVTSIEDITVPGILRFQLDSDVCSADLLAS